MSKNDPLASPAFSIIRLQAERNELRFSLDYANVRAERAEKRVKELEAELKSVKKQNTHYRNLAMSYAPDKELFEDK